MAMLFMASALGTPPFGMLVDKVGLRSRFLLLSSVVLTMSYAMIFSVRPSASMMCLGVVYMVFAGALWPAFALTVPQKELGSAYGIAISLQNAGLALMPMLVGFLETVPAQGGRYVNVIRLFLLLGMCGVAVASLICRENAARHGVLELPSSEADQCCKDGETAPLQDAKKRQLSELKA